MIFVDFVDFIIIGDCEMYGAVCIGGGGGGMKNCDVVDIETCDSHILSFEYLKLSTDGIDEFFDDVVFQMFLVPLQI